MWDLNLSTSVILTTKTPEKRGMEEHAKRCNKDKFGRGTFCTTNVQSVRQIYFHKKEWERLKIKRPKCTTQIQGINNGKL